MKSWDEIEALVLNRAKLGLGCFSKDPNLTAKECESSRFPNNWMSPSGSSYCATMWICTHHSESQSDDTLLNLYTSFFCTKCTWRSNTFVSATDPLTAPAVCGPRAAASCISELVGLKVGPRDSHAKSCFTF